MCLLPQVDKHWEKRFVSCDDGPGAALTLMLWTMPTRRYQTERCSFRVMLVWNDHTVFYFSVLQMLRGLCEVQRGTTVRSRRGAADKEDTAVWFLLHPPTSLRQLLTTSDPQEPKKHRHLQPAQRPPHSRRPLHAMRAFTSSVSSDRLLKCFWITVQNLKCNWKTQHFPFSSQHPALDFSTWRWMSPTVNSSNVNSFTQNRVRAVVSSLRDSEHAETMNVFGSL